MGEVLYVFWMRVVQNFRKVHSQLPADFEMQLLNAGTAFLQRVPLNDLCAKMDQCVGLTVHDLHERCIGEVIQ